MNVGGEHRPGTGVAFRRLGDACGHGNDSHPPWLHAEHRLLQVTAQELWNLRALPAAGRANDERDAVVVDLREDLRTVPLSGQGFIHSPVRCGNTNTPTHEGRFASFYLEGVPPIPRRFLLALFIHLFIQTVKRKERGSLVQYTELQRTYGYHTWKVYREMQRRQHG